MGSYDGWFRISRFGYGSVELVEARVPSVIGYHANFLTELVARIFVKVRFVNLCNILADEEIIPERIMSKCRSDILCEELVELVSSKGAAKLQIQRAKQQLKKLRPGCGAPSQHAAPF